MDIHPNPILISHQKSENKPLHLGVLLSTPRQILPNVPILFLLQQPKPYEKSQAPRNYAILPPTYQAKPNQPQFRNRVLNAGWRFLPRGPRRKRCASTLIIARESLMNVRNVRLAAKRVPVVVSLVLPLRRPIVVWVV